jgi:hypothetical protein
MSVISQNLSLIADGLGFLVLAWKTLYDLWWNPRRFKGDRSSGIEAAAAALAKRTRADTTNWIAFGLLAVSYFLMIIKDLQ